MVLLGEAGGALARHRAPTALCSVLLLPYFLLFYWRDALPTWGCRMLPLPSPYPQPWSAPGHPLLPLRGGGKHVCGEGWGCAALRGVWSWGMHPTLLAAPPAITPAVTGHSPGASA